MAILKACVDVVTGMFLLGIAGSTLVLILTAFEDAQTIVGVDASYRPAKSKIAATSTDQFA